MDFEVRNFYHLLGKKFRIPTFQRGYRWEKRQVTELLDDLDEFVNNYSCNSQGAFYCLQPIVVQQSNEQQGAYNVIDGQQRLTTIYLIMQYLQSIIKDNCDVQDMFTIEYARHAETDCYLSKNTFLADTQKEYLNNADNYYIYKAYQTITNWFLCHKSSKLRLAQLFTGEFGNAKEDKDKYDVRVIWYELPKTDSDVSAIDSFARLNEGKIHLTNAELVKALLLQCSNDDQVQQEIAMRHAMEWDQMEKQLQDPLFWGMLAPADYNPLSHIELLIDFVAKDIKDNDKDCYVSFQEGKNLFSFLVINKAIMDRMVTAENIWQRLQHVYTILRNWYYNIKMYHLVGLYTLLNEDKNVLMNIRMVYDIFAKCTKEEAFAKLRKEIGNKIRVEQLDQLTYGENNKQLIAILETFNVYLHLSNEQSTDRFRFDLFKHYKVTSLEHIHPQNLDTDNMDMSEIVSWYNDRKDNILKEKELEKDVCQLDTLIESYNQLPDKEKTAWFADQSKTILDCLKSIDAKFDELAGMSPEQMHTLYNMALIDKDTNAALSNGFLYEKRNILHEREQKTYIPIGTWAAFDKRFSNENIIDMKFWSPIDRNAYFAAIQNAYNYFVNL